MSRLQKPRKFGYKSPEISALTGLRGVAAGLVLFFHVRLLDGGRILHFGFLDPFSKFGYLGVDIFFILSGFLLSYIYGGAFGTSVSGRSLRKFWGARIARIYPLHLATTFLMLGIFLVGERMGVHPALTSGYSLRSTLISLLLVQEWVHVVSPDSAAWSISVEWASYILFPLYMLAAARATRFWPILVVPVSIALAVLFPNLRIVRGTAEFALGCATFQAATLVKVSPWLQRGAIILLPVPFILSWRMGHEVMWLALGCFSICVWSLSDPKGNSAGSRIFSFAPIVILGEISYSVYLLQWPIWAPIEHLGDRWSFTHEHPHILVLFACVAVLCVSGISYAWFERPTRAWLRKLFVPHTLRLDILPAGPQ